MVACEICGNPEIRTFYSTKYRYFCSYKCKFKGTSLKRIGFGFLLLITGLILFILGLGQGQEEPNQLLNPALIGAILLFLLSIILLFLGFVGLIIQIPRHPLAVDGSVQAKEGEIEQETYEEEEDINIDKLIYVEELDKRLRPCCYQTYRLGEIYCPCGRVVPQVKE